MITIFFPPFVLCFSGVFLLCAAAKKPPRKGLPTVFLSMLLIFRFTLFPTPRAGGGIAPAVFALSALRAPLLNLTPLRTVLRFTAHPALFCVNVLGNVALFVPFGAALRAAGKGFRRALTAGALLSLSVEATQLFLPERFTDVDDLLLNLLGTAAGWAAGSVLSHILDRVHQRRLRARGQ